MKWLKENGAAILLFAVIMLLMLYGFQDARRAVRRRACGWQRIMLRRAVVSCYALEGRYPPDVKYLQEQYGLQLNEEKYIVHYEVFAENIMPDITVLER